MKRECVSREIGNKVTLLREKCLCVKVLLFIVTTEWGTRVCRVIHYLG